MHPTDLMAWKCRTRNELPQVARELLSAAGMVRVFALYGELGAGKTTLIGEMCRLLQVREQVTSPTFNILNEYVTNSGDAVYHFDFYRIHSETEAYDLGYEEYFFSGRYCFIEWPERVASLLPTDCLHIRMEISGDERIIQLHS